MIFAKLRQSLVDPMSVSDEEIDQLVEFLLDLLAAVQMSAFVGGPFESQLMYHVTDLRATKMTRRIIVVVSESHSGKMGDI